jgi:integrase
LGIFWIDAMSLTAKAVEAAKPREKGYKLTDGAGLYLFVTPAGGKSWRANFIEAGKQKTRTYGMWPALSLAAARQQHTGVRDEAPKTVAMKTFEQVARDWLKGKLPTLSNGKHQIQVENTLERYAFPVLGAMPIDTIRRADLVAVARAAQAGDKIETGHRVASRITAVFNHAQDTGVIETHPAAGLTRVLVARKTKKPMASIPPEEAGDLLRLIDTYPDTITRLGLQLLSLTFVRVRELSGMRWDELREDGAVWVVPEERMKLRKPHVVPLPPQAQKIIATLREMTGDGELVLDSPARPGHALSENTFLFALYRLGYRGKMTAHGFRALASTVLNEHSGFQHDVIERQLSHQETDAVRAAYNRAEYLPARRELMLWWANWLDSQRSAGQPPASV